jgi:transketolase
MRSSFRETTEEILRLDDRTVLLLGDIGVFGFRNSLSAYPERVFNIGVLEQATIGVAAGMAIQGMIPFVHSIAPFLVERALEQIKIDFGYQALGGNLVSVGASLDYAALGCTHHAPGDVGAMMTIPGVQILLPGSSEELDQQLKGYYDNGRLSYFRLSESENSEVVHTEAGDIVEVRPGSVGAVLAIGPTLDIALQAVHGLDVAVFYMNSIDQRTPASLARKLSTYRRLLIVEPYYEGTSLALLDELLSRTPMHVACRGIPRAFHRSYGTKEEHYNAVGLHADGVQGRLERLLNA